MTAAGAARVGRIATARNAPPTSSAMNTPQPASSTTGHSGFQLTPRSIRPKPGKTSQVKAQSTARSRAASRRTGA